MEDEETQHLRQYIERYRSLLRTISDERVCRELERLLKEAQQRLEEIELRGGPEGHGK